MYRTSNNYTRSCYTSFSPYNNYWSQRTYGEIKDFWSYSVNNLATTDVDSVANRTTVFRHLPATFKVSEDTFRYILHSPGTEALPTYRLGQELLETFDRISENVFVESLAIKFVIKIMAPVRVRVFTYFDLTHVQRFSFQSFSDVSGDLFWLQRDTDNGPTTASLAVSDGRLAPILMQANGTILATSFWNCV
jgi:type III secretory pathway component EscR